MDKKDKYAGFRATCLMVGTMIGAGILALPINTGIVGIIPSLVGMLLYGAAMFYSALVLSKEALVMKEPTYNYPTLYGRYLGFGGKWIAIFGYLVLFYGALTAYLSGVTVIIANLINLSGNALILCIFFIIFTFMVIRGIEFAGRYNVALTILLFLTFAVMIFSVGNIQINNYKFADWKFLPLTIPIILCAFTFHNVIPTACRMLSWDIVRIRKAILTGIIIGYIMNGLWIFVVVGALPLQGKGPSLIDAFEKNLPATVPLSKVINSNLFVISASLFAFLAIATSYLGCGISLKDFFEDLFKNHFKIDNNFLVVFFTFAPPFLCSILYPNIFIKALDIAGGIGIVILFGILPTLICIKKNLSLFSKRLAFIVLALFCIALIYEVGHELGLLKIRPEVEYLLPNKDYIPVGRNKNIHPCFQSKAETVSQLIGKAGYKR
jgi:tyrosine-specific transport protein